MTNLVKMNGFPLTQYINFRLNPLKWLYETQKQGEIVTINPKHPRPSYVIYDPTAIKEILTTKDAYFEKGNSSRVFKRSLGNGLLTSEGDEHRVQRKMLQPAFHKKKIIGYSEIITRYSLDMLKTWKRGEERRIDQDMMNLTLRIIMKTMFGKDELEHSETVTNAVNIIIEKAAQSLFLPFPILDRIPSAQNRRYQEAMNRMDHLTKDVIDTEAHSNKEREHLLALLLTTKYEDGSSLSEKEIKDQVITFLIAGHETTANVLSWIWYLLSQHPKVERRFHEELDHVLMGKPPTFDHVSQLTYTTQIFHEALRLYPAAWIILREAKNEVQIAGYTFTKGSTFLISPYAIHRHPAYYEEPERFNPDRFDPKNLTSIPNYAYIPFGAGSRGCIGSQFALMESVLIMASIGQYYRLTLSQSNKTVRPEPLLSLRIKNGIKMNILDRT
ncbi:cytochrome P450 [Bacillus mesophilus]|uniref:Cytochrome P450 n=1 Tax=Bacillus mesophilus TaxID=1808955 RepID=A0A6M0QBC3_9BACI|nr:cytochrome P450 [Bacillus mesophilus]MBM7663048.1 cytochrome P450 [Bacillus mesophilus]NEY73632.1 cytochrome P450 [Bacillus mesophilus]